MMDKRYIGAFSALIIVGFSAALAPASAQQDYPSKPIKVVVPFLAGGAVDVVTRLVFNKLSER